MDQGKDLEVFFVVSKIEPETEEASDDESDEEEIDECNQESKQQIVLEKLLKYGFIHEEDIKQRFHAISAWRVAKWKALTKKGANCDASHDDYIKGFEYFMKCLENFCKARLQALIEKVSSVLIKVQSRCLDFFLEAADTLHKDAKAIMEVLKKAKQEEKTVHTQIVSDLDRRKKDITDVISSTIEEARADVLQEARTFKYDVTRLSELISRDGTVSDQAAVDECRAQIHSMVTNKLVAEVRLKLMQMFSTRDQFFSDLQKHIRDLEKEILTDAEAPFIAARALTQTLGTSYNFILKLKKPTEGFFKRFLRFSRKIFAFVSRVKVPVGKPEWKAQVASEALDDGVDPQEVSQNLIDSLRGYFVQCHETFQNEAKRIISLFKKGKTVKDHQRKKIRELAPDIAILEMRAYSVLDQQKFGTPRKGALLGQGGQGCVYECPNVTTPDGKACVVKTFCLSKDEQLKDLSLELHTTRAISHPNVLPLVCSIIQKDMRGHLWVSLVSERMKCDLQEALPTITSLRHRIQITLDVAEGLRYLHEQNIVHRDVKTQNVLLNERNQAKVTDMGLCKPEALMNNSLVGTLRYMAPEMVKSYGRSVDVYAFGILLWFVCEGTGRQPNNAHIYYDPRIVLLRNAEEPKAPERLPVFTDSCWQLMKRCWGPPERRPTFDSIIRHLQDILKGTTIQ